MCASQDALKKEKYDSSRSCGYVAHQENCSLLLQYIWTFLETVGYQAQRMLNETQQSMGFE